MKTRLAIWGYGYFGKKTMKNLCETPRPDIEVVAIVDKRREIGLNNEADIEFIYAGVIKEFYQQNKFDAVMIAILDAREYLKVEKLLHLLEIPIYEMMKYSMTFVRNDKNFLPCKTAADGYFTIRCQQLYAKMIEYYRGYGIDMLLYDDECVYLDSHPIFSIDPAIINYSGQMKLSVESEKNIIDECCIFQWHNCMNYGHFICEVLDKVFVMEKTGYAGKYMLPNTKYAKELVFMMNIDDKRIVWLDETLKEQTYLIKHPIIIYTIDNPDFGRNRYNAMIWREWVKSMNVEEKSNLPKRLYVKRLGHRSMILDPDITRILNDYGFEEFIPENHSVKEQMIYFHNADIVVTPHGANSTNCLFMKQGSVVLEVCSPRFVDSLIIEYCKLAKIIYMQVVAAERDVIKDGEYENESDLCNYRIFSTLLEGAINNAVSLRGMKMDQV